MPKSAALITGASKRIGREIALALARRGLDIALHFHHSSKEAEETRDELQNLGVQSKIYSCDLMNIDNARTLVHDAFRDFPHCNLLVNNASIFHRSTFEETTEKNWDDHFTVNLKAPFFLIQEFSKKCSEGQILNMLDTKIAKADLPYWAYTLSKKGLAELTRMAAKALAPRIRVNGICPGLILPPEGKGADYLEKMSEKIPAQKVGAPKDITSAMFALLDNLYVTGQFLFVDGGQHLR